MKIGYIDAFSGASGDMLIGALLDAGLPFDALESTLATMSLGGYRLLAEEQVRRGISGCKFTVVDEGTDRPARNLAAVAEAIHRADLSPAVVERSLAVFRAVAVAEAAVHGVSIDEVHFHEIGAVDSLIDIVGFCWGLERLGIEALYASPLPLGSGSIRTEHGLLPVPAPATLEILAAVGAPTVPTGARGELVTPTGAALLAVCAEFRQPAMAVQRVGYGFGTKEFPWANMLRLWVGEAVETAWTPGPSAAAHDHDHGHDHPHPHEHPHGEGEAHDHDHDHGHDHDHPHGPEHGHTH